MVLLQEHINHSHQSHSHRGQYLRTLPDTCMGFMGATQSCCRHPMAGGIPVKDSMRGLTMGQPGRNPGSGERIFEPQHSGRRMTTTWKMKSTFPNDWHSYCLCNCRKNGKVIKRDKCLHFNFSTTFFLGALQSRVEGHQDFKEFGLRVKSLHCTCESNTRPHSQTTTTNGKSKDGKHYHLKDLPL